MTSLSSALAVAAAEEAERLRAIDPDRYRRARELSTVSTLSLREAWDRVVPSEAIAAVRARWPWLDEDTATALAGALRSFLRDTLPMLVRLAEVVRPLLRAEVSRVHRQYRQRHR